MVQHFTGNVKSFFTKKQEKFFFSAKKPQFFTFFYS